MRQTPLPLLRNLAPNVLVVRCGLCHELVLNSECCSDITHAPLCPTRAEIEQLMPRIDPLGVRLLYPLANDRLDA